MRRSLVLAIALAACGGGAKDPITELQDPNTCAQCHAQHYTQWSGSMHAYASDDPIFLAMNKRGQRDTQGQLGKFCLQCHAPMAVALGLVDDSNAADFDPTSLPPGARGITCYFCHDVAKVADDHNNGLVLAMDDTMRGGVKDPVDSPAHHVEYDPNMDSYTNNSTMCGSCHDVVTPMGVPLETTYQEWQTSVFAFDDPKVRVTCSGCHMRSDPTTDVIASGPGLNVAVKSRPNSFHVHTLPAIDKALTDFPDPDEQAMDLQLFLDPSLVIIGPLPTGAKPGSASPGGICLQPLGGGQLTVRMDTVTVGHNYPSGAAQDRRVWLEVKAYDASNNIVFQSGVVPDGKDPEDIDDPNLVAFWDHTKQADGSPAHFFWDVASTNPVFLKEAVTNDSNSPLFDHSTTATFNVQTVYSQIDHVEARIVTLPVAYSVLDLLVQSGDLDPTIASQQKTLQSFGATQKWTKAGAAQANPFTGCCPLGQYSC
jgi:hypothetical protein